MVQMGKTYYVKGYISLSLMEQEQVLEVVSILVNHTFALCIMLVYVLY